MSLLQKINAISLPLARLMGVAFIQAEPSKVVATMLVRPDLCTGGQRVHGGTLMALADSVGAAATVINLPPDAKGTTTIESKTNFVGSAAEGTMLTATATPVHLGRRTQVWTTRIETDTGKLVAVITQTQLVL